MCKGPVVAYSSLSKRLHQRFQGDSGAFDPSTVATMNGFSPAKDVVYLNHPFNGGYFPVLNRLNQLFEMTDG